MGILVIPDDDDRAQTDTFVTVASMVRRARCLTEWSPQVSHLVCNFEDPDSLAQKHRCQYYQALAQVCARPYTHATVRMHVSRLLRISRSHMDSDSRSNL